MVLDFWSLKPINTEILKCIALHMYPGWCCVCRWISALHSSSSSSSHKIPSCIKPLPAWVICCLFIWYDVIWHFIQHEQRSVWVEIEFELHKYEFIKLILYWAAAFKFLEYSNLKFKANTWNWMWELFKMNHQQLQPIFPIHIQMSLVQAELCVPEHLEGTFVPWATGWQLPPPTLPTVVWHSSLSQLQAMWHCAFPVSSANEQVFFTLGERDANCVS